MKITIVAMGIGAVLMAPIGAWAEDAKSRQVGAAAVQPVKAETPGYKDGPPPRADPLDGPSVALSRKEQRGVAYGRQWANNPDLPARGEDGGVTFVFGATLPTVVCAPLYVCDLVLQDGESVNDINAGDSVRWQITPASQGVAEKAITHIIIKPTDVGLTTNLVITTNRRAYTIKLVSRREEWMPRVSFHYPEEVRAQWGLYRSQQDRQREATAATEPVEDAGHLDFSYTLSGDAPWRPIRVYASRGKTYIQFPRGIGDGDLPALVALAGDGGLFTEPTKQLVNYRFVNGRFEVDKVLERAALISGAGSDQVTVKIDRQRGN